MCLILKQYTVQKLCSIFVQHVRIIISEYHDTPERGMLSKHKHWLMLLKIV